jgi:hypothetical protein
MSGDKFRRPHQRGNEARERERERERVREREERGGGERVVSRPLDITSVH